MAIVTINPSGRTFRCEGKQTILEAALAVSISLPYGCSIGTCGQCQIRLLQGEIERVKHHDFSTTEADRLKGRFLACAYTAASSTIVVEAIEATSSADIPAQHINAKIKSISMVCPDIAVLSVQTPRSSRLRFLAGQNVRLTLENEISLDLPIASCPCDDRNLEFHVRRFSDDAFSQLLCKRKSLQAPITIDGPWGTVENEISTGPVLCLCFDVHIAAVKGWVELQLTEETADRIDLVWFAAERDFYLTNLLSAWSDAFDNFSYKLVPVRKPKSCIHDPVFLETVLRQTDAKLILISGPRDFVSDIKSNLRKAKMSRCDLWIHSLEQ